jgi:Fe-Mn family superoxide dismutase
MSFELPPLPYKKNALAPYMSEETLEFHYDKHHNAYVTNLNNLIKDTPFESMTLEEIILSAKGPLFNNAAQIWNHTFFWNSLTPEGNREPDGKVQELIRNKWGNFENFKIEFGKAAMANFGSGWTWLVLNKNKELEIANTSNAENPITSGLLPLICVDVWEHAYYIDYRNARADFLKSFWSLVNWKFANLNLGK